MSIVVNNKNVLEYPEYSENYIRQSNVIIKSVCKTTLNGKKFFKLLISMVGQEHENVDNPYYFRVKDLAQFFHIKSLGSAFSEIQRVATELMGQSIKVAVTKNKDRQYPLLSMSEYDKGYGIVGAKIHIDIKPIIKDIKENFTEYQLKYIMCCKSKFTIDLYEMIKMYDGQTIITISMDDLKKVFDAEEASYEKFSNFKAKCIDTAVNEINKKTDLRLSYECFKEGKKYTTIRFVVETNQNINDITGISNDEFKTIIDINYIINAFKKNTNDADIGSAVLTTLIEQKGMDVVKYYAENIQYFITENTKNIQGLFIDAVKKHDTAQEYTKPLKAICQSNKIPQNTNFKQREYDDDFYDKLYENA